MTIYAFGNGYLLSAILQAIVLFFENNNIGVLFTILGTIAVFYYAIRVAISHQHSALSTAKYFLAFFIILSTLIYNRTSVIVTDISNPGWTPQKIVSVPWGIAVMWSGFTTVQYALAKDFTNDFSVPAGDNLLAEGVGVSIVQQADSATISTSNSYLYQDYNEYIANCVAPGISTGAVNVSQLLASGDATNAASPTYSANTMQSIWTTMSNFTAGAGGGILTNWYSGTSANSVTEQASGGSFPGGTSTTCLNETNWLQLAVQDYITQDAGPAVAGEMQFASFSEFSNALGVINPYMFNMQQTGVAQLTQAVGVNMYAPAILKMAAASGASASSLAYATGEGSGTTQQGMYESGILAGKYMPIVFGLFEALFLVASVIILILIVTHMGLRYLKLMFEVMMMIAIWPALTAGFNYITQLILQAQYGSYSGLGYSVSASGTINSFLSSSLAWMGYFSWSVPIMSYAIASGSSYAMTSMVGGMDSAISKNASVKGAGTGIGNLTAGVDRSNMMTGNSFNVAHTQNTGNAGQKFTNEYGKKTETERLGDGMYAHMTGADTATITQGVNGQNVATATKGSDGKWHINNVSSAINGSEKEALVHSMQTSLDSKWEKLETNTESATNMTNQLITARNTYDAKQGYVYEKGKMQTVKAFNSTKGGTNTTVDHSTSVGKTATVGVKVLGMGGGMTTGNSRSVNTGTTTANMHGVARNIGTDQKRLETLSHSHDAAVAKAATKELSKVNTLKDSLTKAESLQTKLAKLKEGEITVGGNIAPAYLNRNGGFSHLSGVNGAGNALREYFNGGASLSSMESVMTGMTNFGKKSMPGPNVNSIATNGDPLEKNVNNAVVKNSSKIKAAGQKADNAFQAYLSEYGGLNSNANSAYGSPLPGIGSTSGSGESNHWVNTWANPTVLSGAKTVLNNNPIDLDKFKHGKKDFLNTGIDEGLGLGAGVMVGAMGMFSQSAAKSAYSTYLTDSNYLTNPGAFRIGLNSASTQNNINSSENLLKKGDTQAPSVTPPSKKIPEP